MKKSKIVAIMLVILVAFFIAKNYSNQTYTPNSQWQTEYLKKQKRHKEGLPGTKKMRIKEVETYFKGIRTKFGETESNYPANYLMTELEKAKLNSIQLKSTETINWIQRGPGNVGGRTRAVVVDVSDPTHQTWFAGSATGGAWKTLDGGLRWVNISEDIPYQAISAIVQSQSNPKVLYIGTGESFTGSMGTTGGGIFKSTDKGETWKQLEETAGNENFRYINRLVIHPIDSNIVLAATTSGIYKTIDGGENWNEVYASATSVEDLKTDSSDFNYIYAGVNSLGIIRSANAGDTWELSSKGILGSNGRFEIAISPTNSSRIYISVENKERGSDIYVSSDKAANWNLVKNSYGKKVDYLGGQAGYDNAIAVHPYSDDTVFVAGVNAWKIAITDTLISDEGILSGFDTNNTSSFLAFVDFGGTYPGLETGNNEDATNLSPKDFTSVEVRFGPGLTQKAHRFTVPDQATSGVPASDYSYQDYVDVPFEVWDVTNNIQLMCSFRDQENDGSFNLYQRTGEDYGELGREYLFINGVAYNSNTPDVNIAVQSGRSYKLLYFLWFDLSEGGNWNNGGVPESKIIIEYLYPEFLKSKVSNVSDAYQEYSGMNTYDQSVGMGKTSIPGFHPDHHAMCMVQIDKEKGSFWIVNGNDGGIGISKDNGQNFKQITQGYITSQFYGLAKKPYRNEYFGGMQDNGSWQSPSYKNATAEEDYLFRLGGDGFEAVWNTRDTNQIMGSIYNNDIYRSNNHGLTWISASKGIEGDGPFITKLTMLPSNPKRVYAVGSEGLWYTVNFGSTAWLKLIMPTGWVAPGRTISSSHQIKYSIANDSILWAGAALSNQFGWNIFVSTDAGKNFVAVSEPTQAKNVFVSNIATHPTEPNTAYLIYSLHGEGKIIRTEDLGANWEDITGFGTSNTSSNGFPDVGCLSLFVFPDTPTRIWAGTEIGIVESIDNGESWNLLQSNLPTAPIFQIFMQDNQIVVGTFGRGIWTYQYGEEVFPPKVPSANKIFEIKSELVKLYPNPTNGLLKLNLLELESSDNIDITIFDINGRLIEKMENRKNEIVDIDLSGNSPGNYIIRIITSKNITLKRVTLY